MRSGRRGFSANDVFNGLRDDILSGEYAPGFALVEELVASKYEVSRTPVRAGLLLLAQEGLVTIPRNGPAVVKTITARDVVEIFEMREALEGFAIEHSTARLDRAALKELLAAYDRGAEPSRPATAQAPEVMLYSTDTTLHHLLFQGLGNERASATLRLHTQQIARVRALLWRMADPLVDQKVAARNHDAGCEHQRIIESLLDNDVSAARDQLAEHFHRGRDSLIGLMMAVNIENVPEERLVRSRSTVATRVGDPGGQKPSSGSRAILDG